MTIDLSTLLPIAGALLALAAAVIGYVYKLASIVTRLENATAKLELVEKKTELQTAEHAALERRVTRLEERFGAHVEAAGGTGKHQSQR